MNSTKRATVVFLVATLAMLLLGELVNPVIRFAYLAWYGLTTTRLHEEILKRNKNLSGVVVAFTIAGVVAIILVALWPWMPRLFGDIAVFAAVMICYSCRQIIKKGGDIHEVLLAEYEEYCKK